MTRWMDLERAAAQAVKAKSSQPLPPGSQVLGLGTSPTLFELVHSALPEALQNERTYAVLAQELTARRLAENGASFIGAGEYVLPPLAGSNTTWNYTGRVGVSLTLTRRPTRVTQMAAGMSLARKGTITGTDNISRTTGPTYTVGGAHPHATASAAYKNELTKGFTSAVTNEHGENFTFPEGATIFETHAELCVTVEWDKERRTLALWARGAAHKDLTLNRAGCSSSDGSSAQLPQFKELFAKVPVTYAVPSALVRPRSSMPAPAASQGYETWL